MKRVFPVCMLVMLLLSCVSFSFAETNQFSDEETGIVFPVPDGWEELPSDENIKYMIAPKGTYGATCIAFTSMDLFPEFQKYYSSINRDECDYSLLNVDLAKVLVFGQKYEERQLYEEAYLMKYGEFQYYILQFPLEQQTMGITIKYDCKAAITLDTVIQ